MVGQAVEVSFDTRQETVILSGLRVAEHEGGDAGIVGPEGEDEDVEHEADMFKVCVGNAWAWAIHRKLALVDPTLLRAEAGREALLDGANAVEVFVKAGLIGFAATGAEGFGLFAHHIEDACVIALEGFDERVVPGVDPGNNFCFWIAEEPVEGELRNDLFRYGRLGVGPTEEGAESTRKAAASGVDACAGRIDAELEAGQGGTEADALRGELIDGGATGIEVTADGAFDIAATEPGWHFGPVAIAPDGVFVPKILDQQEVFGE